MMIRTSIFRILIALFLLPVSVTVFSQGFKHPGLLHTQEDFERIKAQLADKHPAVVAGMKHLRSSEWAQLGVGTWPVETIKRGVAGDENYINAARGAHIAYMCALRWHLGDGEAYAQKAVDVLNRWAATTTGIGGNSNYALASGIYGYEFANAGELLRNYEGWAPEDFKAYQDWMKGVWYPVALGFLKGRNGTNPGHYWSNWGLCNALCLTSIGVLCDDMYIYNQGLSYYKDDYIGTFKEDKTGDDMIINDGYNEFIGNLVPIVWEDERGPFGQLGQMQESGRDQGHTLMAVGLATDICQIAWNQGEDLFAYMDNRLAAGIEYIAAYNNGIDDLPWKEYWYHDVRTPVENSWKQSGNNPQARGQHRPYWDRILAYYTGIKGVNLPHASLMAQKVRSANGGADFGGGGSTSGGYDHLGYSTLTCTRPAVSAAGAQTTLNTHILYKGKKYASTALLTFQPGDTVTLVPTLPDTVPNTTNWLWDTGATTQQLQISTDSSHIYRIYYTNVNGVISSQAFSILVYGDCPIDVYQYSIISESGTTYDTISMAKPYSKVNMLLKSLTGQSTFVWNTGETSSNKQATIENADTSFTVTATNIGGATYQQTFTLKVEPIGARYIINQGNYVTGNRALVVKGQTVLLNPTVKRGLEGGTWLWSTGETSQNLELDNIQDEKELTVTYTHEGTEYVLHYNVVIVADASAYGYWPMDEVGGNVITDVWHGNDGDINTATRIASGAKNGAIQLDGGVDAYLQLKNDLFSTLDDFTITAWVNPSVQDTWCRIWDFGTNTTYYMFLSPKAGDGYVRFAIKAGGSEQLITTTKTLPNNRWSHIAVTKEGNSAKLYINGVLAGSNPNMTLSPSDLGYTTQNYMGKSQYPDPMFVGTVDELQIYTRAFSATEVVEQLQDVDPYEPGFSIDGGAGVGGNFIAVDAGQSVELTPVLKAGMQVLPDLENVTWLWDNGATTQNLVLQNIQASQEITLRYAYNGSEFAQTYTIKMKPGGDAFAYWPMDETEGITALDTWNGNNGSINSCFWTEQGKFNGALKFNGEASSYVRLPDNFIQSLTDFTMAVWVKPEALDTWARIFDFGANTNFNMFLTPKSGDGYVRFAMKAGGTEQQLNTTKTLALNQWTHIAITKSGNAAKLYLNGVLAASNNSMTITPSGLGNTTQNYIGKSQWPDPLFKGTIDEFQMYKKALSQEQIATIMAGGVVTQLPDDEWTEPHARVYPTISADGNFTLKMYGLKAVVTVYDLAGNEVKQFLASSNETTFTLTKHQMYLVKVTTNKSTEVFKIIKKQAQF